MSCTCVKGIISGFPGLGRVHTRLEERLAGGQTRLVEKVVCFKCGILNRKSIFSAKAFLKTEDVVVDVLHVEAQARGQALSSGG